MAAVAIGGSSTGGVRAYLFLPPYHSGVLQRPVRKNYVMHPIHTTVKLSQEGILKLAPRLHGLATIQDELQKFMVKVSLRGHESFGNFLPGSHDDLIYALGLASWYASSPWGLGDPGITF